MATKSKPGRGGKVRKVKKSPPYLPIRITTELLERIDEIRPDMIPREPFVRHVIEVGLQVMEEEG